MDEIVRQEVDRLKENISNSQSYMEYQRLKKEIQKRPDLYEGIKALRKEQYQLQINEENHSLENISRLWQEHSKVLHHDLARHYLNSEIKICKMISKIREEVLDMVDLGEITFVEG